MQSGGTSDEEHRPLPPGAATKDDGEAATIARAAHPELAGEIHATLRALRLAAGASEPPLHVPGLGRLQLRGRLASGGMATVYRAHDPLVDRDVAVKVLPGSLADVPGAIERFRREARATTGNVPVSRRVGLRGGGTDDVDAICALDPGFVGPPPIWCYTVGGPQVSSVPWPFPSTGGVRLGSHRTPVGFQFMLQGCPPAGCSGGPGVLFLNLPGGLLPIATLTLFQPPATNLLQVPLPFAQPSPVLGAALDVYWVRADLTRTSLDASQAMRVNF